jgi:hypothetical protein
MIRVLVSANADVGTILGRRQQSKPSVILSRRENRLPSRLAIGLPNANRQVLTDAPGPSAIIVFEEATIL